MNPTPVDDSEGSDSDDDGTVYSNRNKNGDCSSSERLQTLGMKGIIVKITLQNFMAYEYTEIVPGHKLNLIIGPNGSGKSSIVTAIVLCLGGVPKDLGKEIAISEFVKYGSHTAEIMVELYNPEGSNFVIRRAFSRSTDTWAVNGVDTTLKEVEKLTKSLNIQVDNPCQILPQDKVHDFTRMNAQMLLVNTELAIGPGDLSAYHKKLIDLTTEIREVEKKLNQMEVQLKEQEEENAKVKADVANLKEWEMLTKLIEELKMKRAWFDHRKKKIDQERVEAELKEVKDVLKECRIKEGPSIASRDAAEQKVEDLRKKNKANDASTYKKLANVNEKSGEVDNTQEAVVRAKQNVQNNLATEIRRKEELDMIHLHINKLENDRIAHCNKPVHVLEEKLSCVDTLRQELELQNNYLVSLRQNVATLREKWLPLLTDLIRRINDNFGKFFADMGYAGEVLLSQGSDPNDFEAYGIQIKVKYHAEDDLCLLDQFLQSGGERTVAIGVYLIALQELTHMPFRCVDEINQGMDPINERRVFNILVNATRSSNSQYFFGTPKLLPQLKYSNDVTVIIINYGRINLDNDTNRTFSVSHYIDIARSLSARRN